MKRAVFLDRDGVLTEEVFHAPTGRFEAPLAPEDFALRPGVGPALRRLVAAGFALFLVSNQGSYARGLTTLQALWGVHRRLVDALAAEQVALDDCFYAFGHPEGIVPHFSGPSLARKPSPYFLLLAAARYELDLAASWMLGDQDTDMACGAAAGVRTILIASPHGAARARQSRPEFRAADITAAAALICAETGLP